MKLTALASVRRAAGDPARPQAPPGRYRSRGPERGAGSHRPADEAQVRILIPQRGQPRSGLLLPPPEFGDAGPAAAVRLRSRGQCHLDPPAPLRATGVRILARECRILPRALSVTHRAE